MCGFMAIVGKESVEFDKTNLIDGSHNEVKQSIARGKNFTKLFHLFLGFHFSKCIFCCYCCEI